MCQYADDEAAETAHAYQFCDYYHYDAYHNFFQYHDYYLHNMHEFELPVTCNEKEYLLPATFIPSGYTHRIRVVIEEQEIFFEPDEEGSYRAFTAPESGIVLEKADKSLLAAIIQSIEFVFSGKGLSDIP